MVKNMVSNWSTIMKHQQQHPSHKLPQTTIIVWKSRQVKLIDGKNQYIVSKNMKQFLKEENISLNKFIIRLENWCMEQIKGSLDL